MSRRDPFVRLRHMRDFARRAQRLAVGRSRVDLDDDETLGLALTHLIELVGEAASQVPSSLRDQCPQLPWPKIVGIRNRLIHGYQYVDYDVIWNVVHMDLPVLLAALDAILSGAGEESAGRAVPPGAPGQTGSSATGKRDPHGGAQVGPGGR